MYKWCCKVLEEWGAADRAAVCCLYVMLMADLSYREAVEAYADFCGVGPEVINSRLCYVLLSAGCAVHPQTLFQYLKWKGEEEFENGISVGQGS